MTNEELIEAEAEYIYDEFVQDCHTSSELCVAESWQDLTTSPLLTIKANDPIRKYWRDRALAHFKVMNGWGVRVLAPENNDDPRTTLVAVDPLLPEDKP